MTTNTEATYRNTIQIQVVADAWINEDHWNNPHLDRAPIYEAVFNHYIRHGLDLPTPKERGRFIEILLQAASPGLAEQGIQLTVSKLHVDRMKISEEPSFRDVIGLERYRIKANWMAGNGQPAENMENARNGWNGAELAAAVMTTLRKLNESDTVRTAYAIASDGHASIRPV